MRRAWSWVVELAEQYELETIVVSRDPWPRPIGKFPGQLQIIHMTGPASRPRGLIDWVHPDAATADRLARLGGSLPDRIVVFRLQLHDVAMLLPPEWQRRAEMDCDDWESATRLSIARVVARYGRWNEAAQRFVDAFRHFRLERHALQTYAAVYLSAGEDVRRMSRYLGIFNVAERPNRIAPIPDFTAPVLSPGSKSVFFVGTLGYPPNEDAVRWIGSALAPRLLQLEPAATITIAGHANGALQAFMAQHNLTYLHAPPDLSTAYAEAGVVVAPLRAGGGTKMKVLEAWQHARPVVATSHAARGLGAVAGRHLLVANRSDHFAKACAELLSKPARAAAIAAAGADLLRTRFTLSTEV